MNRKFNETRTGLANEFATAGATLLDYMGTAAALAAIPSTEPPRYVVAGTLAEIVKLLPAAGAIAESAAAQPVAASAGIDGLTRYMVEFESDSNPPEEAVLLSDVERLLATQSAKQGAQQSTLDRICDLFGIGALARSESTIMENVRNAIRREECLSAIERTFFMVPAEPDEDFPGEDPGDECLLGWGRSPEQYVEQFRAALKEIAAAPAAPLQTMDDTTRDAVRDAVADALGGVYYCGRVWSAWSVGTMSEDDFTPASEVDEVLDEITDAAIRAMKSSPASTDQKGID